MKVSRDALVGARAATHGVPAYIACPRYGPCACNDCPLDPFAAMHGGPRHALGGEEPCRATRAVRERVAAEYGLAPGFALLPRERARDARRAAWGALPVEDRERRLAGLRRRQEGPSAPLATGVVHATAPGGPRVCPRADASRELVYGARRDARGMA